MNINIGCDTLKYLKIFVPGIPASKGSMSISRSGHMYPADKKLKKWSRDISLISKSKSHDEPTDGPVSVTLSFYFSKKTNNQWTEYTKKPDIDKISRAVLDALTGIIYIDDCQVYHLEAKKLYAEFGHEPGVVIEIRPATQIVLFECVPCH